MRDIFDAIERLSAMLSFSIQRIANAKGWASKPYSFMVAPSTDRGVMIVSTSIHLPSMRSAGFTPRRDPEEGGKVWQVDIRRTDGVVRETWADGLRIQKTDGRWMIMYGAVALSDDFLDAVLEDLGTP